jgi:hypothetical protein
MVLSAAPLTATRFPEFFSRAGVIQMLQQPGGRHAGWNLQTEDQARIVRGELLEVGYPDWKLLQLYEDGTLLAKVSGDGDFLAWASTDRKAFWEQPKLNPLALIEFVYSFAAFYAKLVERLSPTPQQVRLRVEFRPLKHGDSSIYLSPYAIDSIRWQAGMIKYEAKEAAMEWQLDTVVEALVSKPERTAYVLVEHIYAWFGASSDEIPYTTGSGDLKQIDLVAIQSGGKLKSDA